MPPAVTHPAPRPAAPWELGSLTVILALFVLICCNEIGHLTFMGQDFPFHALASEKFALGTPRWFFMDPTSRPLLYAIGGRLIRVCGEPGAYLVSAYAFVGLAAGALLLLHDASRRVMADPLLRLAALALIAFLPSTLVTTVVFAADTLALLPFVLCGWSLLRALEAGTTRDRLAAALLCGLALGIGNFAKATFFVLPVGVAVALVASWRAGRLTPRAAYQIAAAAMILPLVAGLWLSDRARTEEAGAPARHTFDWSGTGEMTVGHLLLPQPGDGLIFQAPVLLQRPFDPVTGVNPLVKDNGVSYPALFHLGTFTDVLDFAGNNTVYRRQRPARQAAASRAAVWIGLVFSAGTLASTFALILLGVWGLVRPGRAPAPTCLAFLPIALAWYLPLTLTLPFVHHVYGWAYWLPRLVLPALWIFLFLAFERFGAVLPARFRLIGTGLVVALVAAQSACGILSVWY